jgi:hypothetical protein
MNLCPHFTNLLSDFFENLYKRSEHSFVEHLTSFIKFGLGKAILFLYA